ncbi:Enhancer of rudimentary-like protein [Zea mays]|uniref:Enhancer of rudimentary-like protein n=1 Tax=Zea mays TaxID=4577 RepID=A0A1D6E707_MAIZE|nr:Enhancer of rudimentary-like protein [Zea mays]
MEYVVFTKGKSETSTRWSGT